MSRRSRLALPFDDALITLPDSGVILALRAQTDDALSDLPKERLICVQGFRPTFEALKSAGFQVQIEPPETAALTLVQITRSKAENLGNIARALRLTVPGGQVVVDGLKTDGIESLLKYVKKLHPVDGTLSKAHGKVFWLTRAQTVPDKIAVWEQALFPSLIDPDFVTSAGMFSAERVDPGSRFLSQAFAGALSGRVADLGAGWGALSALALRTNPDISALDLFEAEHSALSAAKLNITDPRAGFFWQDVTAMPPDPSYDAVICNPPFHQSRQAEPALGVRFIEQAARMLAPKGTLWLVANRQLPYEAPLNAAFKTWSYLAQTPQYKLIKAERPKP